MSYCQIVVDFNVDMSIEDIEKAFLKKKMEILQKIDFSKNTKSGLLNYAGSRGYSTIDQMLTDLGYNNSNRVEKTVDTPIEYKSDSRSPVNFLKDHLFELDKHLNLNKKWSAGFRLSNMLNDWLGECGIDVKSDSKFSHTIKKVTIPMLEYNKYIIRPNKGNRFVTCNDKTYPTGTLVGAKLKTKRCDNGVGNYYSTVQK